MNYNSTLGVRLIGALIAIVIAGVVAWFDRDKPSDYDYNYEPAPIYVPDYSTYTPSVPTYTPPPDFNPYGSTPYVPTYPPSETVPSSGDSSGGGSGLLESGNDR